MKRSVKTLAVLTVAACLILNIGVMSKSPAFAGSMAWVASVDPQMGGLPVYAEASDNSGIVGSLPRCAQVDLTGNEQASWVQIAQPIAGWVQSNLLSLNALLCSQRSAQSFQTQPSVSVTSVEPVEVQSTLSVAPYGVGPQLGFGPPGGWLPQPHWEPGHWNPGHMEGGHWIPGHWQNGHWVPGHLVGGHWVPGQWEPGHWTLHNTHNGNHPISLTKGNNINKLNPLLAKANLNKLNPLLNKANVNKLNPLSTKANLNKLSPSLNKANNVNKFKTLSLNKANLKTASFKQNSLGKMNSGMKLKTGFQGGSFKGGIKHASR